MGSGSSWQKRPKSKIQDSFLEALRELSFGEGKDENVPPAFDDFGKDKQPKTSGQLFPGQSAEIRQADLEAKRYKGLFFQERNLRHEERKLRVRDDQEVKFRLEAVREDLKKLMVAQVRLEQQVEIAVIQSEVSAPGVYHLSFFEQLRQLVANLRKNVEMATNWLSVFNQKSKKKGYYWGQVKRKGGGSNFYLSGERYMSTQAG